MSKALLDYLRCPEECLRFEIPQNLPENSGFFRLGTQLVCYGRTADGNVTRRFQDASYDAFNDIKKSPGGVSLPFDPNDVIDQLRLERWVGRHDPSFHLSKELYYLLRPLIPDFVRALVHRMYLRGWKDIPFPHWPVDTTVDRFVRTLLELLVECNGEPVPFIWFWPDGAPACAVMTHDIETTAGRIFCSALMDLDDNYGIKSSFQVVPEVRYEVPESFLQEIQDRGFEVNIHDLNHDGRLFRDRRTFLERAEKINQYARKFKAAGFRAGAMHRVENWLLALNSFKYDMSVPNAAQLEPQRGGCCTVMPYFIGHLVELPLTATQDYHFFNVLNEFSIELWKEQIEAVSRYNGLVTFITHPDYLIPLRARHAYSELLEHLAKLRNRGSLWVPLPREVNEWWRQRAEMKLVRGGDRWVIEGDGSERARVAFAHRVDGNLVYTLNEDSAATPQAVNPRAMKARNS